MRWPDQWYDTVFRQEGAVDVVLGGSSRMRRGVYAHYLEQDLKTVLNKPEPVIYNIGVAGHGTDAQILPVIELLERREVRYVFFQVDMLRAHRFPTHRNLQQYGRTWDILVPPVSGSGNWEAFTHRTELLYKRISLTLDTCLSNLTKCFAPSMDVVPASTADTSRPRAIRIAQLSKFMERAKERGSFFQSDVRKWHFERGTNQRTAFYLDLLREAAVKNGAKLVLIDLPKYQWPELTGKSVAKTESRFKVDLLRFPQEQLRRLGENAYGDYGHFNYSGEREVRSMIIDYIERDLARKVK